MREHLFLYSFRQVDTSFILLCFYFKWKSHVEITQIVRAVSRILKRYHGCGRINRSGTRKLIDYKTGERCLVSTNQRCWRKNRKNLCNSSKD